MRKIGVFVPCYNTGKRIQRFLCNFDNQLLQRIEEVLVVNNASEDDTLNEILKAKRFHSGLSKKIKIINNKKNYGLGGSHKIAFDYFLSSGFSHVLVIPSNYKGHVGKLASRFLNELDKEPSLEVIFGCRPTKSLNFKISQDLVNKVSDKLSKQFGYLVSEYKTSDIGSRFVLIKRNVLEEVSYKSLDDQYSFNLQLNILIQEAKKYKVSELKLKTWVFASKERKKQARYSLQLLRTLYKFGLNKHVLQKKGWKLFSDFPDNVQRDYELL